jgi:chromosome segregation ATPase
MNTVNEKTVNQMIDNFKRVIVQNYEHYVGAMESMEEEYNNDCAHLRDECIRLRADVCEHENTINRMTSRDKLVDRLESHLNEASTSILNLQSERLELKERLDTAEFTLGKYKQALDSYAHEEDLEEAHENNMDQLKEIERLRELICQYVEI